MKPAEKNSTPMFTMLVTSFSLVAILSCVSIGMLTFYMRAQGIRDEQYRLLETLRDEKVKTLSSWFFEKEADVNVLITRPDIRSFCANPTSSKEIKKTLNSLKSSYQWVSVFLADSEGTTFASTEEIIQSPGDLPGRQAIIRQVLDTNKLAISDVFISTIHNKPITLFVAPVADAKSANIIGVVGILMDPNLWLYPPFTQSEYLGKTGEILMVNSKGLVQSPLKYSDNAICSMTITAEPARRGSAGETGRIAVDDYRPVPVMAAYGHISTFNWGIVVKQDMAEINAPVQTMAWNVTFASAGVLLITLIIGFFIAGRISKPALKIAEAANLIGQGNLNISISQDGPAEIRQIAVNMNSMVAKLGQQVIINQTIADIIATAGKHNHLSRLLDEILPLLMDKTGSQLGVIYLTAGEHNIMEQCYVIGCKTDTLPAKITVSPPDHLLSQHLHNGETKNISTANVPDFTINSLTGETPVQNLMIIPLILRMEPVGVIGLGAFQPYDNAAEQVVDGVKANLAQAVEICRSFEQSETMRSEINARNKELERTTTTLQTTTIRQKNLLQELEKQRQQVAETDRLKSEFLSNMSHELRTPLNSVLSLSQLMLSSPQQDRCADDRNRLIIIERNGQHLLHLINDILDLSKIEAGKMDLHITSFYLHDLINQVTNVIQPLADEHNLTFTTHTTEPAPLTSDQEKIHQILLNLLANAIKFTERGVVSLHVETHQQQISFAIKDSGCGIPKSSLPYIFDEFRQVDGSTTRQHGGTGLGLAISRRLAHLLSGTITVQSTEGHGSTFTLTIPQHTPGTRAEHSTPTETTPITTADRQLPSAHTRTILIVEDHPDNMLVTKDILAPLNLTLLEAHDGLEAVEMARTHHPDIILMDINLPLMSGLAATKKIKQDNHLNHIIIIALTAKAMMGDKELILAAGCDAYLAKPIKPQKLQQAVKRYLLAGVP